MDDSLKLGIDSRGADEGARVYVAAVRKIDAALDKLDRNGTAKLQRLRTLSNAGGFSGIAQAAAQLNAIKISPASARNIERLSASLMGFKGVNRAALRSVADLYMALTALQRVGANPAVVNTLANIKGPSVTAVRNLQAFSVALEAMRPSPHADTIIRQLNAISAAAGNLRGINSGLRSLAFLQNGAVRAQGGLRGLGQQFSLTSAASNLFGASLAAITFASFIRQLSEAQQQVASFRATMSAVVDADQVEESLGRVTATANRLAIDVAAATEEFPRLAAAMLLNGHEAEMAHETFDNFALAMRVTGVSAERQRNVISALAAGFSRGKVETEDFNEQLSAFPGAMALAERAIERATGRQINLAEELRRGTIGADAFILLGRELASVYGGGVAEALNTSAAQSVLAKNAWRDFVLAVGDGGLEAGLADFWRELTDVLRDPQTLQLARDLGADLADALRGAGAAFRFAVEHAEELATVAKVLLALQIGRWAIGAATSIGTMATQTATFARALLPLATRAVPMLLAGLRLIPGLGIAVTIGGIAAAALDAGGAFREFQDRGLSLGDSLMGMLEETGSNFVKLGRTIGDWASGALEHVRNFWNGFRDFAGPVFDWVGDRFNDLSRWAGELLSDFSRMSGWDAFARNSADRGQARRDRRERAELRGTLGVETPVTPVGNVDPFRQPRGNSDNSAARELERLRRENERWVSSLSPAADMLTDIAEAERILARAQAELEAAGLSAGEAQERFNAGLRQQYGLASTTETAFRALAQALEVNRVAEERGVISAQDRVRLDAEAQRQIRETLGLYNDQSAAVLAYQRRVEALNEVLGNDATMADAVADALARANYELREQLGAVSATESAMHAYGETLKNIAAIESQGADGGLMRRRAGASAMSAISGASGEDFSGRVAALQQLAEQGAITSQEYRNAMAEMTASTLEFQVAAGQGDYVDQFLAGLIRMTEGARNMQATMGNLMTEAAASITEGIGNSLARAIVYAEDLQSALYDVVNQALAQLISGLIQMGIQMLISSMIGQAAQTAATTAASSAGASVASSWAPAAAAVSLASYGANAAPAMLGIGATYAMTQALSMAGGLGMKDGGPVVGPGTGTSDSVPRMLSNGEFVVNAQAAAANMGTLQAINAGASPSAIGGGDLTVEQAPITVNNIYDPAAIKSALSSTEGQRVLMNVIGDNSDKIRSLLSR